MNSYVRIEAIIQNYSGQNICHVYKKKKTMVWIIMLKSLIKRGIIYRQKILLVCKNKFHICFPITQNRVQ